MLSIGQFSKTCQVSVKTLHHYDKIGLVCPYYIEEHTGYRYYHEDQLSIMLFIQRLKRYGFPLSKIKQLLSLNDPDRFFLELENQKHLLILREQQLFTTIQELEGHLRNFERTGNIMGYQNDYEISLRETLPLAIVSSRQVMAVSEFGKYYEKVFMKINKEQLTPTGKTLAIYHDQEFHHERTDAEVAVAISDPAKATRILPGRLCACTIHKGPYSSLSDAYAAVVKWIQENHYHIADAPYEIYVKNQFDALPPSEWETEVYFPVEKAEA